MKLTATIETMLSQDQAIVELEKIGSIKKFRVHAKHGRPRIGEDVAVRVHKLAAKGKTQSQISSRLGIGQGTVSRELNR